MKKEKNDGKIIIKISIMWIFVLALIIGLIISFFKNYIFATNEDIEESTEEVVEKTIQYAH